MDVKACLQITMKIKTGNRNAAAKVYSDFRESFLARIPGALTKQLLVRNEDVQVLHGFDSVKNARAYLDSDMFRDDVFNGLKDLWDVPPDVRIYECIQ